MTIPALIAALALSQWNVTPNIGLQNPIPGTTPGGSPTTGWDGGYSANLQYDINLLDTDIGAIDQSQLPDAGRLLGTLTVQFIDAGTVEAATITIEDGGKIYSSGSGTVDIVSGNASSIIFAASDAGASLVGFLDLTDTVGMECSAVNGPGATPGCLIDGPTTITGTAPALTVNGNALRPKATTCSIANGTTCTASVVAGSTCTVTPVTGSADAGCQYAVASVGLSSTTLTATVSGNCTVQYNVTCL